MGFFFAFFYCQSCCIFYSLNGFSLKKREGNCFLLEDVLCLSLSSRLLGQRPFHFYVPKWLQYFIFLVEFSQLSNNIDATKMAKVLPSSTLSLYLFLWHCNSSKIILVSTNKFLFLSEWLANLAKCVMLMLINKHRRCQERLRRFCCRFNFNRIHGFEFESWGRILD